ncbi:hypothetical protein [Geobacter sp. DSM 9736]|uniref:hypothetical protein n=1 Tax=Geobacter sp. DSM 9736 TaxID=1277350 RepID=UPI000B511E80|nr:hypothetical protein [Geobacter sp. DSM 9736]SNB47070.1 hypothetical protein SAMN06269301_2544 [Geobacter sp. DSM 9736]
MTGQVLDAAVLKEIIAELEETVEQANLLALELALKSLEDETDASAGMDEVEQLAGRAARATVEVEQLVRRLKAA